MHHVGGCCGRRGCGRWPWSRRGSGCGSLGLLPCSPIGASASSTCRGHRQPHSRRCYSWCCGFRTPLGVSLRGLARRPLSTARSSAPPSMGPSEAQVDSLITPRLSSSGSRFFSLAPTTPRLRDPSRRRKLHASMPLSPLRIQLSLDRIAPALLDSYAYRSFLSQPPADAASGRPPHTTSLIRGARLACRTAVHVSPSRSQAPSIPIRPSHIHFLGHQCLFHPPPRWPAYWAPSTQARSVTVTLSSLGY